MTLLLFRKLIRLLVKERMEYRSDFILAVFAQIIHFAGDYLIIWLFIQKFNTIAGWTWPEIALLYSFGLFTYALGASFSFLQMRMLEDNVKSGSFDTVLTKPVNAYLYVISRGFNLGYIAHVIVSGSVMIWALMNLDLQWSFLQIIYLILILISGSMIHAAILTVIGSFSFIWVRTGYLFQIYGRLRDFISYPLPIYGNVIQLVLTFVIPLAFVSYFPASFLLSKETPFWSMWLSWLVPLIGPLCCWLSYRLWSHGIHKYQGAGG